MTLIEKKYNILKNYEPKNNNLTEINNIYNEIECEFKN